jgi:hypothetical protein
LLLGSRCAFLFLQFPHHRRGVLDLRKCRLERRQHDRLDLIRRRFRRVERRGCVADEEHLVVSHVGFTRRRFAAYVGTNSGDDDGIDAPIAQDQIEIGAVEGAVARLLQHDVVLADDDAGVKLRLLVALVDEPRRRLPE